MRLNILNASESLHARCARAPECLMVGDELAAKIEPLAMSMLIPLFFNYTGLRTNFSAVGVNLGLTAPVIGVAIAGKVGGAFVGATVTGLDARNSLSLGFLLNTRGLVELIVLNVGLDLGILSPELFSIMVIMALVTPVMTTPALKLLLPKHQSVAKVC